MIVQLIKDKIPEIAATQDKIINYAELKSNDLYLSYLKDTLANSVNSFFKNGTIEDVIDIQIVLNAILKANQISQETLKEITEKYIATYGEYENRYIAFLPKEPRPEQSKSE